MYRQATLGLGGGACAPAPTPLIAVKPTALQPSRRSTGRPKRRRAVACIVAAGLGLGAALYPLPRDMQLLKLFPPGEQVTDMSSRPSFDPEHFIVLMTSVDLLALQSADASDLMALGQLLSNYPGLPTNTLLEILHTYGVTGAVTLLRAALPALGGGGFAFAPSGGGTASALPVLMNLVDYLKHAPQVAVGTLSAVITNVLPKVLVSLGMPAAPTTPPPAPVSIAAAPAPAAPAIAPDPGPAEAPGTTAPEPPAAAPTLESASTPSPDPQPQPTSEATASSVPEPTKAASAITNEGLSSGSVVGGGETEIKSGGLSGSSPVSSGESPTGISGSGVSTPSLDKPVGSGSVTGGSTAGNSSSGGGATGGDSSGGGGSTGSSGTGGN
jgi:hypothetical protein